MEQRIGLIAMSCKPYHGGHDGLLRRASKECDIVKVFVSLSDRVRKGEIPIYGEDMEIIWHTHVMPTLPKNVFLHFGGVPVRNVYEELGIANETNSNNTYVVYADTDDLEANFGIDKMQKYVLELYERGHIELVPVARTSTVNVSGTKMRHYLEIDDKKSFISNLPVRIKDKNAVWDLLKTRVDATTDSKKLLGDYVALSIPVKKRR